MRLVGALLFVALTGSMAVADDAPAAPAPAPAPDAATEAPAAPVAKPEPSRQKVPLRVVRVLADTRQVLLFDKTKGTHVLAEVGQTIEGYAIADIDDDEVTLDSPSGTQVVLAAPVPWRRRSDVEVSASPAARPAPATAAAATAKAEPQPADPYADGAAPMDPYADAPAVRSAEAPPPADQPVRAAEAPGAAPAPVAAPATAPSPAAAPAPVAAPTPAPVAPPASPDAPITLPRADVSAALSNFTKLSTTLHATFTPAGARIDSVAEGSVFSRAGLRAGDVVAAVDNQALHSLDDVATLYARAASTRNVTVHVVRADKPLTLHIAIQ